MKMLKESNLGHWISLPKPLRRVADVPRTATRLARAMRAPKTVSAVDPDVESWCYRLPTFVIMADVE